MSGSSLCPGLVPVAVPCAQLIGRSGHSGGCPYAGRLAELRLVRVVAWGLPGPAATGTPRRRTHVGPYETIPLPRRPGARGRDPPALATALAADKRDRSI